MGVTKYPFVPKSTALMDPGQFWSLPLKNGRFACGRVLQLKTVQGKKHSRMFLAGLMDWVGSQPPTSESIAGRRVLEQGEVHIKTILESGGQILGCRSLHEDGVEPGLFLDQSPGEGCTLMKGFDIVGPATREQQSQYPVFKTWGYGVIRIHAEKHFGGSIA